MKKILVLLVLFACVAVYAQNKGAVLVAYSEEVSTDASLSADCWQNAKKCPLHLCNYDMRGWPRAMRKNVGNKLRNPGYVQFLWNEKNLYIGVMMEDADVVAESDEDQDHHYRLGDVIEVFLKPRDRSFYWEMYGTPKQKKTVFFFPSRGRHFLPSVTEHPADISVTAAVDGTLNDWSDQDKGWSMVMAIPVEMLERQGYAFRPGQNWTVLVARQNYSADLPMKEHSTLPRLSQVNFHLYEEYGDLILLPPAK